MFFKTKITPKIAVTAGRRPPGPPMGGDNNSAGRTAPKLPMAGAPVRPTGKTPASRATPPAPPTAPPPKITITVYETDAPGGRYVALWPDQNIYVQNDDEKTAIRDLAKEIATETGEPAKSVFNRFEVTKDAPLPGPDVDVEPEFEGDPVSDAGTDDDADFSEEPQDDFATDPADDEFEDDDPRTLEDDFPEDGSDAGSEDEFEDAPAPEPTPAVRPTTPKTVKAPVDNSTTWETRPTDVLSFLKVMALVALRVRGVQTKGYAEQIVRANFAAANRMVTEAGGDAAEFRNIFVHYGKPDVAGIASGFAKSFRKATKQHRMFSDIRTVPPKYKDLLDPILSAVVNPSSENQMGLIGKRIGSIGDKNIEKEFARFVLDTVGDHGDLSQGISDIVKNATGEDGSKLSQEQIQALKSSDPDALKAYRKNRADLGKRLKAEYKNIVLNSGRPFIPMKLFIRKCEQAGLPTDLFHADLHDTTLVGMNDNANYTDKFGNEIISQSTGKPAGINPDFGLVINDNYEPGGGRGKNWVLYSVSDKGTKNYLFGKTYVADSVSNKFAKVGDAIQKLEASKKRWRQDVLAQADDNHAPKVYSMILEFMYITTCRPGAKEGMTGDTRTFGAMNFLVRHVQAVGQQGLGVTIPIKSGKIEKYLLDPKAVGSDDKRAMQSLVQFIKAKMKGKQPDDLVFTISGKRPDPNKLNAYMRAIGLPITSHKIRTVRGTLMAQNLLEPLAAAIQREEKQKGRLPDTEVQNRFKEAMVQVGKLLAHVRRTKDGEERATWITAAKAYVDAAYTMDWFARLKYRPPKELADAAAILDRDGDGIPD